MKFRVLLMFAVILGWNGIFTENCMADPIVATVSPATVATGQEVHIFGQQFGENQGTGSVTFFDGIAADHKRMTRVLVCANLLKSLAKLFIHDADLNGDSYVAGQDLTIFVNGFGQSDCRQEIIIY